MQNLVDKFSAYYTPAVVAIAISVALIPPVFLGGDWLTWVYRALVMLVVACPCALVTNSCGSRRHCPHAATTLFLAQWLNTRTALRASQKSRSSLPCKVVV